MTRITQRTTAALRDEYRLLVPDKEDIVWALCEDVEELQAALVAIRVAATGEGTSIGYAVICEIVDEVLADVDL